MARSSVLVAVAVLLAAELAGPLLHARQPAYRIGVDFVTVSVTLTDKSGISLLRPSNPDDFVVLEDGVRQDIEHVVPDRRPISVSLVLDASNSMTPLHRSYAHDALDAIARGLTANADAEVSQLAFARSVVTVLPWTQASVAPTVDWNRIPAGDDTSLFDAVYSAMEQVDTARTARTVIVLATDGGETTSTRTLREIVATRRQSESAIYAFHITPWNSQGASAGGWSSSQNSAGRQRAARLRASVQGAAMAVTRQLVGDSGGTVYSVRAAVDAKEMARNFLQELNRQLVVGYTAKRPFDGSYRRLEVRTRLRGVEVRHRRGYLALPSVTP